MGGAGQAGEADAPICSVKQNDLFPRAPPSSACPPYRVTAGPKKNPLWTFREAQKGGERRRKSERRSLEIKSSGGFLEGLRRRRRPQAVRSHLLIWFRVRVRWIAGIREGREETWSFVLEVFCASLAFVRNGLNVSKSGGFGRRNNRKKFRWAQSWK